MLIKEFEANTLKDCLQRVREALGPDAVILETRKIRKGGLLGMGARDMVKVVAATGITVKSDSNPNRQTHRETVSHAKKEEVVKKPAAPAAARNLYKNSAGTSQYASNTALLERDHDDILTPAREEISDGEALLAGLRATVEMQEPKKSLIPDFKIGERISSIETALHAMTETIGSLRREQREVHERTVSAVVSVVEPALNQRNGIEEESSFFPELSDELLRSGITPELVKDLIAQLPDTRAWKENARTPLATSAIRDMLARSMPLSGPIRLIPGSLKAAALIGPTGVGKTTTIAKLAAHYALIEKKKVALLTMDTYRIAAVEQLKTYSQIMGIPVAVAYNYAELMPAMEKYADYDLLLIDTAGRSQKNIMQVGELKGLLDALECETHLVVSASYKTEDMLECVRRFAAARVDRLIFSKLDETNRLGNLYNVLHETSIPCSYLTTGQKVPEDLEQATAQRIISQILM